ncbi:unnamed protein product [Haemonchus placei]|uniref:Uncharacterized protein n=1 Tax=Haemonchus placei TaxID=6290 RepID=A0A3P7UNZ9_HAEPC|nr:unnamed protein product [Haemonchus placei]
MPLFLFFGIFSASSFFSFFRSSSAWRFSFSFARCRRLSSRSFSSLSLFQRSNNFFACSLLSFSSSSFFFAASLSLCFFFRASSIFFLNHASCWLVPVVKGALSFGSSAVLRAGLPVGVASIKDILGTGVGTLIGGNETSGSEVTRNVCPDSDVDDRERSFLLEVLLLLGSSSDSSVISLGCLTR